jgi:hypothetical protein
LKPSTLYSCGDGRRYWFLGGASVVLGLPAPSNFLRAELTALNYLKVWKQDLESTRSHAVAFQYSSKPLNLQVTHSAELTAKVVHVHLGFKWE